MKWPILFLLVALPVAAQPPRHDKPPASRSMYESTRPPASDELSVAVAAAARRYRGNDPALFVGGLLVDRKGMTLYSFDRDRPGISTCYRACEKLWPPLLAGLDDTSRGDFSIADRLDGARQWAWRGKALYYWPSDKKPGDATGDNVSGVWHVIPEPTTAPELEAADERAE